MIIHELKCDRTYFKDIAAGIKPFEVRKKDRDYKVGDLLAMNEVAMNQKPIYTGRCCLLKVTYILDDPAYCKYGFVILGLTPCSIFRYSVNSVEVYEDEQEG